MIIRIHKAQLKQELLTPVVLTGGIVVSLLYVLVTSLMLNSRLLTETATAHLLVREKLDILVSLIAGITSLYSLLDLLMIVTLGFLMGVNLMLLSKSLREVRILRTGTKKSERLSFGLGVAGLFATSGCASCGITLLSFLGPGISASLIPFPSIFIQSVSLVLLIISIGYTLNRRSTNCVIARA